MTLCRTLESLQKFKHVVFVDRLTSYSRFSKLTHFFTNGLDTDFLLGIVAEVVEQDVLTVRMYSMFKTIIRVRCPSTNNVLNVQDDKLVHLLPSSRPCTRSVQDQTRVSLDCQSSPRSSTGGRRSRSGADHSLCAEGRSGYLVLQA